MATTLTLAELVSATGEGALYGEAGASAAVEAEAEAGAEAEESAGERPTRPNSTNFACLALREESKKSQKKKEKKKNRFFLSLFRLSSLLRVALATEGRTQVPHVPQLPPPWRQRRAPDPPAGAASTPALSSHSCRLRGFLWCERGKRTNERKKSGVFFKSNFWFL
jgi:hypothetical protein